MRRRVLPPRGDTPKVKIIRLSEAARLVTLESPDEDHQAAVGAFCRLKPPEGLSEDETQSWANVVRKVAKAVKVLPTPKSADVPDDAQRLDEDEKVGTVREEALKLAKETGKEPIVKLTSQILDEVGI